MKDQEAYVQQITGLAPEKVEEATKHFIQSPARGIFLARIDHEISTLVLSLETVEEKNLKRTQGEVTALRRVRGLIDTGKGRIQPSNPSRNSS